MLELNIANLQSGMSQKDYVKRGRVSKKKEPEKQPVAKFQLIIAIIVIIGFVAILWRIKDNAPPQQDINPLPEVVNEDTTSDEEELPELPKEEWEFIRTLPGYEVEIDTTERAVSTKRYLMQCGSFRKQPQAEEMRAKIAFLGMEAMVRPSDGDNGRWYRVILGPFDTKRDAERSRHAIRTTGIRTCQIWYWNL